MATAMCRIDGLRIARWPIEFMTSGGGKKAGRLSLNRQRRLDALEFEWTRQATKKEVPHTIKPST